MEPRRTVSLVVRSDGIRPRKAINCCGIAKRRTSPTSATKFELMLRQMDIIGEWAKANANRKLPIGITTLEVKGEIWASFFIWENIPGWRCRMKTSKSMYRSAAAFDLTKYDLLFPLLDAVPHESRTGAILKG